MNTVFTIGAGGKPVSWGKYNPTKCLGYIARILNGKLTRVARVTSNGVDYNYEVSSISGAPLAQRLSGSVDIEL